MLFNIAPNNAEKVGKSFTVSRPEHVHGYKASAILTPKNKRLSYSYQIDIIDNTCIVCTVRHIDTDTIFAIVKLSNYTTESIEVEHGELYKNCSAYPYRREYNDKYLKKYDQIACIVHGAIAAGLLFDTAEATTTEETSTTGQNTACTDTEPQEATEADTEPTMYKYGMRLRGYSIGAQPAGVVSREDDPTGLYYDIITYNRELTPEELDMYSLTPLEAPTAPEEVTAEEEPTTAGKDAQRATQRAADHRQRGRPDRRKGTFSGRISKTGLKIRIIKGTPIFDGVFQKNC